MSGRLRGNMARVTMLLGDWIEQLRTLPDQSVHTCVTSPPYWGLRDYGTPGQLGLEQTIEEYLDKMVAGFAEVRRVLRDDGTAWVNLGDSYASNGGSHDTSCGTRIARYQSPLRNHGVRIRKQGAIKRKDLCGIPWRVAFALQADGWYLRQDIIWHKPNPMPESVRDRCTKAHEYVFLLSKRPRYYFDAEAIKEPASPDSHARYARGRSDNHKWADGGPGKQTIATNKPGSRFYRERAVGVGPKARPSKGVPNMPRVKYNDSFSAAIVDLVEKRNKRSVWTVPTFPYSEAHFATFPPNLVKPCILAGSPIGGVVLDPFGGSGTVGQVALELGRSAVLIELNPEYKRMMEERTAITPCFL